MPVRSMNQKSHQPNSPSGSDFGKSFFRDIRMWLYLKPAEQMNVKLLVRTYFPKQNISMMHHLLNLPVAHNDNRPHMKNIDTPSYPNDLLLVQFDAPNTILIQALARGNSVWVPASSWPLHADAAEAAEAGRLRAFGADAPCDVTFSGSGIEAFFRCPFLLPCFSPLVSVSTLAFQPCHFPTLHLFGEHHLEW